MRYGGIEQTCIVVVAKELQLIGTWNTEAERAVRKIGEPRRLAGPARIRIEGIKAFGDAADERRVFCRECQHRDGVECAAGGYHAARAQASARGFQADEVVESGRNTAGAGRVAAECKTHQAQRHGNRGTGAGSAADVRRVEAVAADAIRGAGTDQAGGELIQVGLADRDCAGIHQAPDHVG